MRLFLDTSVLVGFFEGEEGFADTAARLQAMRLLGDAELWVSARSYVDLHRALAPALKVEVLLASIEASLPLFSVCSLDGEDIRLAATGPAQEFEDRLIDIAAQRIKADVLLTRREGGYETAKTLVMSPEEFFAELEESGVRYEA